ncbi:MAG: M56 family metallopeptidase, partial [Hyphomicrobiales bacterium]
MRIIELTLVGCLISPWLGMIPGYPQWAIGWWAVSPPERHEAVAIPSTELAFMPVVPQADAASRSASGSPSRSSTKTVETPGAAWNVGSWLVSLYLFGVAIGIAWWLVGVAALARIIWSAHSAPPRCRQLLAEIAGRRSDRVRLLVSHRAKQPFASVGMTIQLPPQPATWRRAVIVLPEDLCDDEQAVRWALAHEWAHIERHDFRVWFVAGLSRVLLYYQPLVWWLHRHLRLCQDFMADARASREGSQPEDYAEFLTIRASAGSLHPAMVGLGMGFRQSDLYKRVVILVQ